MKKSIAILLAATAISFFSLVGVTYYQQRHLERSEAERARPATGPLTIGAILPLTGEAAAVGVPIQRAALLAVGEVNASGGVRGRPLALDVRDGRCDAREAVNAAQALIVVERVPVIFGGGCSGETLAVAPLAERAGVVLFSPSATSPAISDAGDYVFRNAPSDTSQGRLLAEAAAGRGYRRVGVLNEETDYAVGIATVFRERFGELGGTVTVATYPSDAAEVRAEVSALKQADVDALALVVQSPSKASVVLRELRAQALRVPLFGNDVVLGASDALAAYRPEVEGLIGADFDIDETSPRYREFIARYEAAYGGPVTYPRYAALSYDAVHLIRDALVEGPEPERLRRYLSAVKDRPGAAGTLTLDSRGDPVAGHTLKQVIDGVPQRLPVSAP